MTDIWGSIGARAASEWIAEWDAKYKGASLSAVDSRSFQDVIKQAPVLASRIAASAERRAIEAIQGCNDAGDLEDPDEIAERVFRPLKDNARSGVDFIVKVWNANPQPTGRPNPFRMRLEPSADKEFETIERQLAAIQGTLARQMEMRALQCRKASEAEKRAKQKHWLDLILGTVTAGSAAWAAIGSSWPAAVTTLASGAALLFARYSNWREM